jgi:adenylate cyclase
MPKEYSAIHFALKRRPFGQAPALLFGTIVAIGTSKVVPHWFMTDSPNNSPECAILFADLTDSTALYERLGTDEAFALVKRSLESMAQAVKESGGRLIKNTGDGIMAALDDADAAATTSMAIHQALLTPQGTSPLRVAAHIGFCFGPVVESEDDLFGDTVNLAARLCEVGSPGIALMTQDTALRLHTSWRYLLRPGPPITLKGLSKPVDVVRLLCDSRGDLTAIGDIRSVTATPTSNAFRLYLNNNSVIFPENAIRISLGRDANSDVQLQEPLASRHHCTIERRGGRLVLIDHSSNGTFVTIDSEREFALCHEETVLHGHGALSFGRSSTGATETLIFFCL